MKGFHFDLAMMLITVPCRMRKEAISIMGRGLRVNNPSLYPSTNFTAPREQRTCGMNRQTDSSPYQS